MSGAGRCGVTRRSTRFPEDFMFQLSAEEFGALRSQFATSNDQTPGRGGWRYAPRVFTEHGALTAATIVNSPRALRIPIFVVRVFVRLRELAAALGDLAKRLDELKQKTAPKPGNLLSVARRGPGSRRGRWASCAFSGCRHCRSRSCACRRRRLQLPCHVSLPTCQVAIHVGGQRECSQNPQVYRSDFHRKGIRPKTGK